MLRLVRVVGPSMAPTYRPGDLLLVAPTRRDAGRRGPGQRVPTRRPGRRSEVSRPQRGDVVVLRRGDVLLLKRLVGVPGDVVTLEAGRLSVDGQPLDGRPRRPGAFTATWRVPPGHGFVVGDNVAASDDSRVWADPFVPAADVHGVVVARVPRRLREVLRRPRPVVGARPAA